MKFQLLPETASTFASDVDPLWWFLVAVTIGHDLLIFAGVFFFAMKYRRSGRASVPRTSTAR
jgi:hypothetical protein